MDIHKIELFLDLAKTLNYTETADNFFTGQASVSKAIISLENELNIKLFDRSHRKIRLSEGGELILAEAEQIWQDYQKMLGKISDFQQNENSKLNILFIPTAQNYQIFKKTEKFISQHPEIEVRLSEVEASSILHQVKNAKHTIALIRSWPGSSEKEYQDEKLELLPQEEDEYVLIMPENDALANQDEVSLSDLAQNKFVMLDEHTLHYQRVIELCKQAGFIPKISYSGVRIGILLNMVLNNHGISILPRKSVQEHLPKGLVMTSLKPNSYSYLSFIYDKSQYSPAVENFLSFIEKEGK